MYCQGSTCRKSLDLTLSRSYSLTSHHRESGLNISYTATCTHPLSLSLSLSSLRVCIIGKRFEGQTDHTERWYGTQYSYRKITMETITQWENVTGSEQLHLPPINEFIPTNFDLLTPPEEAPKFPMLIQVNFE